MTAALLLSAALAAGAAPASSAELFPAPRSDARVELLGMVRLLAHDERAGAGFYLLDRPYERELARRLAPLAGHPAVERWEELERAGLGYVPAYQWILTLGDPPGLEPRGPAPEAATRAAGGAEGLEEFRLLLADFARAADFPALWAQTAALREPLVDDLRAQAQTGRVREDLERYWGGPVALRYTMIFSGFVEPAVSVTAESVDADGTPRLTSLTGAEDDGRGRVRPRLATRRGTLWALALDEALKPAFAAQTERLKASSRLLEETSGRCAPSWDECARKEAAFAAAARLLALAGDRASAEELPVKYARVGMPHIGPLVERLKELEAGRRPAETASDFVPRLLDVYDFLASQKAAAPPFSGGIAAALADPAPCALVTPSAPSPELAAALAAFRRDRKLCGEELTGEQALARGLFGRGAIVVGSPAENAWLAARWGDLRLPARLDGGTLRLAPRPGEAKGTAYSGAIGFVSAARNPDDPSRPLLLFTAQDPALVPGLLGDFSDASDYEIRDGTAPVKLGTYEKSRLPWRTK